MNSPGTARVAALLTAPPSLRRPPRRWRFSRALLKFLRQWGSPIASSQPAIDSTGSPFIIVSSRSPESSSLPSRARSRSLWDCRNPRPSVCSANISTRSGSTVERGVELTSLTQTSDAVRAVLRHSDGREETIETPWVVGCDGAHSTTRHALDMDFEGAQYDESFILADVQLESALARDRVHLFLGDDGLVGVIPFFENRWRIVADIPPDSRDQSSRDVTLGRSAGSARSPRPAAIPRERSGLDGALSHFASQGAGVSSIARFPRGRRRAHSQPGRRTGDEHRHSGRV